MFNFSEKSRGRSCPQSFNYSMSSLFLCVKLSRDRNLKLIIYLFNMNKPKDNTVDSVPYLFQTMIMIIITIIVIIIIIIIIL